MTQTDTNLNQLIINELTQAEYDTITPNANELYVITDGVMQSTDVINALGYTPVNKAGDTMTGELTLDNSSYIIKNPNINYTTTTAPSTWTSNGSLKFYDTNDKYLAFVQSYFDTNNYMGLQIGARRSVGGVEKTAYIKAMVDVSGNASCSFPKTECVDGQWVDSNTAIISSATSLNGSGTLTYRMVLPNDGHKYEVLLRGQVTTGATSGNYVFLSCAGNEITSVTNICGAQTRASNSVQNVGSGIVIASYVASGSTNLSISKNTNFNGNVNSLTMVAYRRIGTNT